MSSAEPAADLERFLGDPGNVASRLSFRSIVEADEREQAAGSAVTALREWGFPDHLVPRDAGGRLRSIEELHLLFRLLARRDLSQAVGYGATFLGALPVWLWGTEAQRSRVAALIRSGGLGSFGLSEAEHGSDVAACDLVAEPAPDGGYLVSGTKWPIGNATRGGFATVFARTGSGPRGFSMLLLDKENVGGWRLEPRVPTMGLRGIDLSGLTLDQCPLPPEALIGRRGHGIGQTLQTLQVTRTMVTAMSLSAADTALRVALAHTRGRRLYGAPVFDIPVIRHELLSSYVDILIAECVARPAIRAADVRPGRLGLWSAIVKYLVPRLVQEVIATLANVLGARHFLRTGVADGVFQKLMRDHAVMGVFDGTEHVNLAAVAAQLPAVLCGEAIDEVPIELLALSAEPPEWHPRTAERRLTTGGVDEIAQSWDTAVAQVARRDAGEFGDDIRVAIARIDTLWKAHRVAVDTAVAGDQGLAGSVAGIELARRHCLLHAAACCVGTWLAEAGSGTFAGTAAWLPLCLDRIADRLTAGTSPVAGPASAAAEHEMLRCLTGNQLFSLLPLQLGG